jgi:hypothetical protein
MLLLPAALHLTRPNEGTFLTPTMTFLPSPSVGESDRYDGRDDEAPRIVAPRATRPSLGQNHGLARAAWLSDGVAWLTIGLGLAVLAFGIVDTLLTPN